MHKRLVPNLLRGRAIDLEKVTFLIFLPIFSEIIDFLKNYPSRFGIKGLIDRPGCRKLPCTNGWSLICLGEEL